MRIGPRHKICRSLGENIFDQCQTAKFQLAKAKKRGPGMGRGKRRKQKSEFGEQLTEKQKIRYTYGITDRQLSNYVQKAKKSKNAAAALYELLERRLDNLIYRLGLAPTRRAARQMVTHGHILVNERRVTIPSFHVSEKDEIEIRPQSKDKGLFNLLKERQEARKAPDWILHDKKAQKAKVKHAPELEGLDLNLDFSSIIEFYSRV